jgi:hypothetical protein
MSGVAAPVVFGVHNNNLTNLVRGLQERVYHVEENGELVAPPKPAPGIINSKKQCFWQSPLKRKL